MIENLAPTFEIHYNQGGHIPWRLGRHTEWVQQRQIALKAQRIKHGQFANCVQYPKWHRFHPEFIDLYTEEGRKKYSIFFWDNVERNLDD